MSGLSLAPMHDFLNNVVEGGPKPTVAALPGVALGGGLELAMVRGGGGGGGKGANVEGKRTEGGVEANA